VWRGRIKAIGDAFSNLVIPSLAGANLKGVHLHHLSFNRFDLSGCNLRGADLRGYFGLANFSEADLRDAILSNAQFAHANFTDANLTAAKLDGTDLMGGQFIRTVLSGADLRGANCDRATFEDVQWDGALFDEKTRFPVGFEFPSALNWCGTGDDPRPTQPKTAKKRKLPAKLDAKMLLSDVVLAERALGLSDDPKLPNGVSVGDDDSIYANDLRFSVLLEYLPHRLAELGLSQREIDFNAWYRCERYGRLFEAVEGIYHDGDERRTEQFLSLIEQHIDNEELHALWQRIAKEVRRIIAKRQK